MCLFTERVEYLGEIVVGSTLCFVEILSTMIGISLQFIDKTVTNIRPTIHNVRPVTKDCVEIYLVYNGYNQMSPIAKQHYYLYRQNNYPNTDDTYLIKPYHVSE